MTRKVTPKRRTKKPRDWREPFLAELCKTGCVSAAAQKAKISRNSAYEQREANQEFAKAWDAALEVATDALEREARRRAAEGVLEPVFYQGEIVAKVKKYSDTLLIFLLKAHRPEKFRENIKQELHVTDDREINDAIERELARLAAAGQTKDAGTATSEKPAG